MENGIVKPDPDRVSALKEFPATQCRTALCRVVGMFAYYAKWTERFTDKVRPLATATEFPITGNEFRAFESLKAELGNVALNSVDETVPFVVECDASDVAVSATLNQRGRPVAFMSRTLHGSELHYPACEKEATAIMQATRKWSHLLLRQTFTLVTDQRSVAFMLDSRRRSNIKKDKIQQRRVELAAFSYVTKYRLGNTTPARIPDDAHDPNNDSSLARDAHARDELAPHSPEHTLRLRRSNRTNNCVPTLRYGCG